MSATWREPARSPIRLAAEEQAPLTISCSMRMAPGRLIASGNTPKSFATRQKIAGMVHFSWNRGLRSDTIVWRTYGLLPLLPLTNGGTEPERLASTIATLYAADEYELLSLTKLLAGLVMKHKSQQDLLERLFAMYKDIVEESWVYQQIVQRGLEKGLGLGEQRALVAIIQRRFPDIVPTAKELIDGITDADTLEKLVGEVSV